MRSSVMMTQLATSASDSIVSTAPVYLGEYVLCTAFRSSRDLSNEISGRHRNPASHRVQTKPLILRRSNYRRRGPMTAATKTTNRRSAGERLFIAFRGADAYYFSRESAPGEVSEWLKEHAWKACVWETVPRVRIPPSPFHAVRLSRADPRSADPLPPLR